MDQQKHTQDAASSVKQLEENLSKEISQVKQRVQKALEHRRQAIVYELARVFYQSLKSRFLIPSDKELFSQHHWHQVSSLSQLRALVGGRFQNLKEKWVKAGFPLREHRGDRGAKAAIDPTGWLELSVWVHKQGFETRLAKDDDPWLIELRSISSAESPKVLEKGEEENKSEG